MDGLIILAGTSFATSLIAAAIGVGGGLGLLSVMPSFLPVSAIVPLHGATQLVSNASRFLFDRQNAEMRLLPGRPNGCGYSRTPTSHPWSLLHAPGLHMPTGSLSRHT
jgi:hypothetical protein